MQWTVGAGPRRSWLGPPTQPPQPRVGSEGRRGRRVRGQAVARRAWAAKAAQQDVRVSRECERVCCRSVCGERCVQVCVCVEVRTMVAQGCPVSTIHATLLSVLHQVHCTVILQHGSATRAGHKATAEMSDGKSVPPEFQIDAHYETLIRTVGRPGRVRLCVLCISSSHSDMDSGKAGHRDSEPRNHLRDDAASAPLLFLPRRSSGPSTGQALQVSQLSSFSVSGAARTARS
jgi:hypothetical protein